MEQVTSQALDLEQHIDMVILSVLQRAPLQVTVNEWKRISRMKEGSLAGKNDLDMPTPKQHFEHKRPFQQPHTYTACHFRPLRWFPFELGRIIDKWQGLRNRENAMTQRKQTRRAQKFRKKKVPDSALFVKQMDDEAEKLPGSQIPHHQPCLY
uniref:F-box domain-containing protein n=1 Tax=Loa loa TaxID=7209 RepID=A0A1I7VR98_LOALO